jgi:hypothetical protein
VPKTFAYPRISNLGDFPHKKQEDSFEKCPGHVIEKYLDF